MVKKEFVVPAEKQGLLRTKQLKLKELFATVTLQFTGVYKDSLWVVVEGSSEDEIAKATEYIHALCKPDTTKILDITQEMLAKYGNEEEQNELERNFGIVVILSDTNQLVIKGTDFAVAMATSVIDQKEATQASDGTLNPVLKEFALKLGFKEKEIESVARKFGSDVDQNTLLQELIHTTASDRPTSKAFQLNESSTEARPLNPVSYRDVVSRGAPTAVAYTDYTRGNPAVIARGSPSPDMLVKPFAVSPSPDQMSRRGPSIDIVVSDHIDEPGDGLRPIVIDGSNVAMSHGNQTVFSCRGIALCVQWFQERGHREITVFVPRWRTEAPRIDNPIKEQEILFQLEKENIVKLTPSRRVGGKNIVCYDDRFILDLAAKRDGVVVSNDNFRDLMKESEAWKEVIESRLLMYSFVQDLFMAPEDPLGRHGPTLDEFLRKGTSNQPRVCPFLGRCTFGPRCRFYHPERDPTRRQQLMKSSQSDPNLPIRDRPSSAPPPTANFQAMFPALDRKRSNSDYIARGPTVVARDPYQEVPPHFQGNAAQHQSRHGNGHYRNEPYPMYPGHVVAERAPNGYPGSNGYYGYPMYVPVTTQQQYSYTPPYLGYTNSASSDFQDGGEVDEDYDAMFAELKKVFPDDEAKIQHILRDNAELCKQRDVNALVSKLLDITQ